MPRSGQPEAQHFDVDRCIELHNKIVSSSTALNPDVETTRGYFTFHAQQNPSIEDDLQRMREEFDDADFCRFLDGVDIPASSSSLSLTPEVIGLANPSEMWYVDGSPVPDTWIVHLYRAHDWENGRGVMFDLETRSATFVDGFFEDVLNSHADPRVWLSLEEILEEWCTRIENGKYVPVHRDTPRQIIAGWEPVGWQMAPFRSTDLDDTVRAWERYVQAIVSRMPPSDSTPAEHSPLDLTAFLDQHDVQGFLRSFLIAAHMPPATLRFIAPGLMVPTKEFLAHSFSRRSSRPDVDHGIDSHYAIVPTTIFPLVSDDGSLDPATFEGLILGVDDRAWEDAVALMLSADTATLPEFAPKPMASRRSNPIFQPGQCPYGFDHSVRLEVLLYQWTDLIENNTWTVGEQGVEGGREWLISRRDRNVAEREGLVLELPCGM